MGDGRQPHPFRGFAAHCSSVPADAQRGLSAPVTRGGTVPVDNVIGKARFIAWPPSRWSGVHGVDPQTQ